MVLCPYKGEGGAQRILMVHSLLFVLNSVELTHTGSNKTLFKATYFFVFL